MEFVYQDQPGLLAYRRCLGEEELLVMNDLSGEGAVLPKPVEQGHYNSVQKVHITLGNRHMAINFERQFFFCCRMKKNRV